MHSRWRWRRLAFMVAQLERCLEANARLDVKHRGDPRGRQIQHTYDKDVEVSLDRLYTRLSAELNRLSCERLRMDLVERQQRDSSATAAV
jgi:hypothetical protein